LLDGIVAYQLAILEIRRGRRIVETSKDVFRVGRDPARCDVVLDPLDRAASREHFIIQTKEGHCFLTNLSSNGTIVQGERVGNKGRRLYHGDVIEAGGADITFLLSDHMKRSARQLLEEGKKNEALDPSFSIQCYSLAVRQDPDDIECAICLLNVLAKQGRYEDLATGGNYFDAERMAGLAAHPSIALPIATAFAKLGDFSTATRFANLPGVPPPGTPLALLVQDIERQTGGQLLKTIPQDPSECPFFERGSLRIYVDERPDFADLGFIDRYFKYVLRQVDPVFGGPARTAVECHVTIRDQLFAQSMPNRGIVLGYYSPSSRRIFLRPRRWIEGTARENEFHIVLSHEYVHLRVHEACGDALPPKWYNEGLAQFLTEDRKLTDFQALRLVGTKCKNASDLSDSWFSPESGDPALAYLQSHAMLSYLANKFPKEELIAVLSYMGNQHLDFCRAFRERLGISFDDLDRGWRAMLGVVSTSSDGGSHSGPRGTLGDTKG
jgi:pSer/pThr/pTyr-binding forkhead associated (FHA) protein